MATFWESLSEASRESWKELCENVEKWEKPTKVEDLQEIDRLMREKPNYSIDKQGRGR
jgi:hypothetical protein